uniref:Uncharacterized protein n=1 Tax=Romanomermis culicivorax TaxID=13658 RepID=A0A915KCJ6_ROMCU
MCMPNSNVFETVSLGSPLQADKYISTMMAAPRSAKRLCSPSKTVPVTDLQRLGFTVTAAASAVVVVLFADVYTFGHDVGEIAVQLVVDQTARLLLLRSGRPLEALN